MKNIYSGKHLTILFDESKSLFIQNWSKTTEINIESFQSEMLAYTKLYEKHKPQNTMWNHSDFNFELAPKDYEWIEINVNIPCKKYGNKKCAFIVGKDVMAHISVMDSFDTPQSCIIPKHFGSDEDALSWILDKNIDYPAEVTATFNGKTAEGMNEFLIQTTSSSINEVLKDIKSIKDKSEFINENIGNYLTLTPKELEVFTWYSKGEQLKNIATELFITENTARTHWRNIKRKLEIKSFTDVQAYVNAFVK